MDRHAVWDIRRDFLRTRRRWRIGLMAVAVLLLASVAGVAAGLWLFERNLDANVERLGDPLAAIVNRPWYARSPAGAVKAVNILVLASAGRTDPTCAPTSGDGADDVVLLVHLPADRKSAQVLAFSCDTWLRIPEHWDGRLGEAYALGGTTLLARAVEQVTKVRLDHVVYADVGALPRLADAVGGADIPDVPTRGDGLDGLRRQQAWMWAIYAKAQGARHRLGTAASFLTELSTALAVDDRLTIAAMRSIVLDVRDVPPSALTFVTAPHSGLAADAAGQPTVMLDRAAFDPLANALVNDTAASHIGAHRGELDQVGGAGAGARGGVSP